MDLSVLSDTITFERPDGTQMVRMIPSREFTEEDKAYFSETEFEILQKICARFKNSNTKVIEDASHKEAPWQETKLLDKIPYRLAAKDPDSLVTEEEIDLLLSTI